MNDGRNTITLHIDGRRQAEDAGPAGWTAEVYALDGRARGAAEPADSGVLAPDTVLELELADGTRLLVAAEDAGRYLGTAARGAGGAGIIEVGQTLRPTGTRLPDGLARDGFREWGLKSLRIYRQGPAGMTALIAAGVYQDAQLEDRNGLYHCAADAFALSKADALPAAAEPTLVFIHGTASSTAGSFGDLWRNDGYRARLAAAYGPRIYAFEHRSLTESPIANALALVRTLPRGARLHLVSHSRGGMVGELLSRADRVGAEPFTESDIARFLAHAQRSGREGFEAEAALLRELNAELRQRAIRVERFVRVACPARGTTLAAGRLDRWASVMLNLVGRVLDATGRLAPGMLLLAGVYDQLQNFLLTVVRQRCDARVLPGLEAMMPDSPLVDLLNAPGVELAPPLHVVAGDFAGAGLLTWLGDCLSEVFYGGETDLVVNTVSMSGGAARTQGIRQKAVSGPQVTHFTYFKHDASALALLNALEGDDSRFAPLPGPSRAEIARGGKEIKRKDGAPIVFLLPGIMGSHIGLGGNRIWFEPFSMWSGEMARLTADAAGVAPDGWLDRNYENLARHLAASHEVRPFPYDWRLSIDDAARRFGAALDAAMTDAETRRQPLRIVAHSMGGLVARLALKERWNRFKAIPGSRLLQLGTPNNGSHSIAAVLLARDDFIQLIERWFDWKHDMREFLGIVRDFPGVLELLPWPGADGKAGDGVDYFDAALWQAWHAQDGAPDKDKRWQPPRPGPLAKARAAVAALRDAPLDPECTLYVAGRAPTPCAVRVADGRVEIGWIDAGDGRVPWATGIPPGVPVWYAGAVHGDLASHEPAFEAYRELIETGTARDGALTRQPPPAPGRDMPVFRPRGLEGHALYPSADEVLAAATGGARPGRRPAAPAEPPARIEVIHGSPASDDAPVLTGAYAHDSLRGSAKFLDGHLGGQLTRTHKLGRYPARPGDAMVFLHPETNGRPGGAIVVGLGAVGELLPGELTRALTGGLLEYARSQEQCRHTAADVSGRLAVASLLVGTGFSGLTIEVGVRCLLDALRDANAKLARCGTRTRIGRLSLYEEAEDRAIAAVQALRTLTRDPQYAAAASCDGRLRPGVGGYRGRSHAGGGQAGTYRVHVVADEKGGGLRFTVISDRARNEVAAGADQRQMVDGLIASITRATQDQPGLSRALFELMVPNGMKAAVAELRSLMLSVDAAAAAYPWELMRDDAQDAAEPLAVRIELVRQLASPHGRGRVPTVTDKRIFVLGDTLSGLAALPGAQAEARLVAKAYEAHGFAVDALYRANPLQVLEALFCGRYRFMHLAGHGVVADAQTGRTGMVLGPDAYLTAAQVNQLRHVPEFVFINCCHLGAMGEDAKPRWGELAANLATQFIELGCKAVIAAGWAVDDEAAATFAQTFYAAMLEGRRFGQAVLRARSVTYRKHPLGNTWGAYQAYGDELYRFPGGRPGEEEEAEDFVHASHLVADLDRIAARLQVASEDEKTDYYRKRVESLEAAARNPEFRTGAVGEKLAAAWAALGETERAIGHLRAALSTEVADASLRTLEQLARREIHHGAALCAAPDAAARAQGERYLKDGQARLEQLLAIGETAGRLTLLGEYWKRRAQADLARGRPKGIDGHLDKMRDACRRAAAHTERLSGSRDYRPLFDALDGAFLRAARGFRTEFDADAGRLADLLQAGIANGRHRLEEERSLFHALAAVEARRIDALWACYDGRDAHHRITSAEILDSLAAAYRGAIRHPASAHRCDTVIDQLRFLIDMLPEDENAQAVKDALRRLTAGIGR